MRKIEVTDEVYEELKKLTTDFNQQPNDVLARLLNLGGTRFDNPLLAYLATAEFRSLHKDSDKYLAILGWVAAQHPADFREYILSLNRGRRHLSMTREEIIAQSQYNQARQIPDTPYWAIMNIPPRAPTSGFLADRRWVRMLPWTKHRTRLRRRRETTN